MVKYLNPGQKPKKNSFKKYLIIGTALTIIAGSSYEYIRHINYWKPRVDTFLSINSPESLEYRIDNLKEDLKEYPQYTDLLIQNGLRAMHEENIPFSTDTYLSIFNVIRDKIEEDPELLDYLGPKALEYQESRQLRIYKQKIKDTYHELKDKVKEMFEEN